jgi:hypothetical protein
MGAFVLVLSMVWSGRDIMQVDMDLSNYNTV